MHDADEGLPIPCNCFALLISKLLAAHICIEPDKPLHECRYTLIRRGALPSLPGIRQLAISSKAAESDS